MGDWVKGWGLCFDSRLCWGIGERRSGGLCVGGIGKGVVGDCVWGDLGKGGWRIVCFTVDCVGVIGERGELGIVCWPNWVKGRWGLCVGVIG